MNPALVAAGFATQALGTGINMYRSNKLMKDAERQLRELENNPIEPYKATSQLRTAYAGARAGASSPRGMSMEDVNRFMINQARNENTALVNAGKMGYGGRGNLSILNAGLSGMSADLASKSAMIQQQNRQADLSRLQGLSSTFQSLANMNANANMQAQQAYGNAIRQQRQNMSNAWSGLANMGGMLGSYGLFATAGGKKNPVIPSNTEAPSVESSVSGATQLGTNWMWDLGSGNQLQVTKPVSTTPFSFPENAYNGMMAANPMGGSQVPVNTGTPKFLDYMRSQLIPSGSYPSARDPFAGNVYDAMESDLAPGFYIKRN